MPSPEPLAASLEAIHFQRKPLLFKELTLLCNEFLENPGNLMQRYTTFEKVIKRRTGLSVHVRVDRTIHETGFCIRPPAIKPDSLLTDYLLSKHFDGAQYLLDGKTKKLIEKYEGYIDLAQGKVSGLFSKFDFQLYLPYTAFAKGLFTGEETAAIILHELGHAFTYYETMTQSLTQNLVIATAVDGLKSETDPERRLKLVVETGKLLDVKLADPNELAESRNAAVIQTVLIKEVITKKQSSSKSELFDNRATEFIADQYAVRQGAARPLAMALDKMGRKYHDVEYRNTGLHVTLEAMKTALMVLMSAGLVMTSGPVGASVVLIGLAARLSYAAGVVEHDEPGKRLDRMRNELIQNLKDPSLPKDLKQSLLEDLDFLAVLRKNINDNRTLMSYVWTALTSFRRNQNRQMKFQQDLEKLVNNEIFAQAAKLEQVS